MHKDIHDKETNDNDNDENDNERIISIHHEFDSKLAWFEDILIKSNDPSMKREVPEFFLDKITFNIMLDPLITPSGITYDRLSLQSHLFKIGPWDPISREPLTIEKCIPNLALRGKKWKYIYIYSRIMIIFLFFLFSF